MVQMMMFLRSLQNQSHYCHKRIGPQDSGSASYVIQQGYPLPSASLVGAVSIGCPGPTKQEAPTNASQIENRHDVGLSYPNAEHRQVAQTFFEETEVAAMNRPRSFCWSRSCEMELKYVVTWGLKSGEFDLPSQFVVPVDLFRSQGVTESKQRPPAMLFTAIIRIQAATLWLTWLKKPYESYYNMRCICGYTCLIIYAYIVRVFPKN